MTPAGGGRSFSRRHLLLVSLPLLVAVAGVVGLGPPGQRWLARRIAAAVAGKVGVDVQVAAARLHPLEGTVTVDGLVFADAPGFLRGLRVGRLELGLALPPLLRGEVRPVTIAVRGLVLEVGPGEGGGEPPDFDPALLSALERVTVEGGELLTARGRWPFELDFEGLELNLAGHDGEVRGSAAAGPGTITVGDRPPVEVRRVSARLSWNRGRLHLQRIFVADGATRAGASASLKWADGRWLLSGGATVSVALERWIADDPEAEGWIESQLAFSGELPGPWVVDGDFRALGPLRLAGLDWEALEGRIHLEPDQVRVDRVAGRSPGGTRLDGLRIEREEGGWTVEGPLRVRTAEWARRLGLDPALASGEGDLLLRGRLRDGQAPALEAWGRVVGAGSSRALDGKFDVALAGDGGQLSYDGDWGARRVRTRVAWSGPAARRSWNLDLDVEAPDSASAGEALEVAREVFESRGGTWPALLVPVPHRGLALALTAAGRGERIDLLDGEVVIEGPGYSRARFDRLALRLRQQDAAGPLAVTGRLALADGRGLLFEARRAAGGEVWRLEVQGREVPLALAEPLLEPSSWPAGLGGRAALALAGSWSPAGGAELDFAGSVEGWSPLGTPFTLEAEGRWSGARLEVRRSQGRWGSLRGRLAGGVLLADGPDPWPVEARGRVELDADLSRLPAELGLERVRRGRVALREEVAWGAEGWGALGWVGWEGREVADVSVPDSSARNEPLAGGGVRVDATVAALDAVARLGGRLKAPDFDLELKWRDLELLQLVEARLRRPLELGLGAWSDGWIRVAGPLAEPRNWVGEGRVERLDLLGPSYSASLVEPAGLEYRSGRTLVLPGSRPLVFEGYPSGRFQLSGAVHLGGARGAELDLAFGGDAELGLLEILAPDMVAAGRLEGEGKVVGAAANPRFAGRLRVEGGRARWLSTGVTLEAIDGEVIAEDRSLRLAGARCRLGGGEVRFEGGLEIDHWQPNHLDLAVEARDVALSFPRGLWGRYDASLELSGPLESLTLAGGATLLAGRYGREFDFLDPLSGRTRLVDPGSPFSSWLSRVGLDLSLVAEDSLTIRNSMALAGAGLRIQVGGTMARPLLSGQVNLLDGGRLSFRDVNYELLSGQLLFDDARGEPVTLRLRAQTELRGYRIQLDLDASPEDLDYRLTSAPALASRDILLLLLTGQAPGDAGGGTGGGDPADLAGAYFGTKLGELLLSGPARRWLGVSHFRISPAQVDSRTSPTARVTLGRRIDEQTYVLYSRDLSGAGRDVYRIERDLGRRMRLEVGQNILGGLGAGVSWLTRFGGGGGAAGSDGRGADGRWQVVIEGWPEALRRTRRLDPRRLSRGALTRAAVLDVQDRVRRALVEAGYIQARLDSRREKAAGRERLVVRVDPGPRWTLAGQGPARAVRAAREVLTGLWSETEFRVAALREAERVLRERLADEGRAVAVVRLTREPPESHSLLLEVDPGPRVVVERVVLEGVSALSTEEVLAQILSRPSPALTGPRRRIYRPRLAEEDRIAVQSLYEQKGFLGVRVEQKALFHTSGQAVDLLFRIEEGEPALTGRVQVSGDWPAALGPATDGLDLVPGRPFLPSLLDADLLELRRRLDRAGYYRARVSSRSRLDGDKVDVTFLVRSGERARVAGIGYEGLERTSRKLVQRYVDLRRGDPVSGERLRALERELFRTGLFRDVEVTHEAVEGEPGWRRVVLRVRETPALALRLTAGYDTEEQFGSSVTLSHDNVGGKGRRASVQAFATARRRGGRLTFEQPRIFRDRLEGLLSFDMQREQREGFTVSSTGIALQIGSTARRDHRWQWIYALSANRFTDVNLDPAALEGELQAERGRLEPVRLGSVGLTWSLDRRNDPFLPTRGGIVRSDVGIFARPLGSEASFLRWRGQGALYRGLGKGRVLAGSLRVGFEWPFAGTSGIPLSERLFAGGASSLRGFGRDLVGPLDGPGGEPLGGEASLVLNLEARAPLWRDLLLVLFVDAGNVWLDTGGFDPGDLRRAAGLGLRYNTPVGALRIEYGFKLDRRQGESPGRFVLSIGEAF
ncbi:MAG: translocation/assembly module TamB domain-containing protein [Acidobacteriota bacterium]|nr:translocation/assembly module TamB domain-containing protein [Acidobacteriota bacterium]